MRATLTGLLALAVGSNGDEGWTGMLLTAKSAPRAPDSASKVTESARAESAKAMVTALASANFARLLSATFNYL